MCCFVDMSDCVKLFLGWKCIENNRKLILQFILKVYCDVCKRLRFLLLPLVNINYVRIHIRKLYCSFILLVIADKFMNSRYSEVGIIS